MLPIQGSIESKTLEVRAMVCEFQTRHVLTKIVSRISIVILFVFSVVNLLWAQSENNGEIRISCNGSSLAREPVRAAPMTIRITAQSGNTDQILYRLQEICNNSLNYWISMEINGEIGEFMEVFFQNLWRDMQGNSNFSRQVRNGLPVVNIVLNSDGGNVQSAMSIGRIIRRMNGLIVVNDKCNSACVLVLASGVRRDVFGVVGIHRPYFTNLDHGVTREQIIAQVNLITLEIARFFEEMGQPRSLLDAMRAVSPNNIRVLTARELENFMLTGEDASYHEQRVAQDAWRYGINSTEMRSRERRAEISCRQASGINTLLCKEAIYYGITIQILQARQNEVTRLCGTLVATHGNRDYSNQELDEIQNCVRNIMLGRRR